MIFNVVGKKHVKKDAYDAKIKDIEYKMPDITSFATAAALMLK